MPQLSALLVDDEARSRRVLRNLLTAAHPEIQIVGEYADIPTAAEGIQQLRPEVVFLDVQMPKYAGYELVNFVDIIDFHIVFVTAYDQYAIKAFELSALDYLLKPINRNRLAETIAKLHQNINLRANERAYQALLQQFNPNASSQLIIPETGDRRVVALADILAIEASGAYAVFHLTDGSQFTTSKNLKYFEDRLPKPPFFRSHRTWIIHLQAIQFRNKSEQTLILRNGIRAKLARSQVRAYEQIVQLRT
ncbi:MAG: response regulator [Bacteroidota bacterium]